MDITFNDTKLEKYAKDYHKCLKVLGKHRAELLMKRIGYLKAADTLEDVRYMPGKFHELTGNRKGQWACDLDQPYRLIFVPHEDPIPTDADGKYSWIEIKGVEIVEIANYHGK
jgi:proteic killer suppression protein